MKVSEKSLELNVGAELLAMMRGPWGMPKAYLRGLTQREEKQQGVDFFVQLGPNARIFAFQFKAPKGRQESRIATPSSASNTTFCTHWHRSRRTVFTTFCRSM
jgi:hypothetical protein